MNNLIVISAIAVKESFRLKRSPSEVRIRDLNCHLDSTLEAQPQTSYTPPRTCSSLKQAPFNTPYGLLFLGRLRLVGLGLRPLFPHTHQPRIAPGITQPPVSPLLAFTHLTSLNLANCLLNGHVLDRHTPGQRSQDLLGRSILVCVDLLLRAVQLLMLSRNAREQDEAGAVSLEALDVGGEGLDGEVLSAMVDGDADGGSQFAGNSSLLFTSYIC